MARSERPLRVTQGALLIAGTMLLATVSPQFQCRLHVWSESPGAWTTCRSPVTYEGLADAAWAFEVQAVDNSGRVTRPPGLRLFQVDNVGPQIVFDLRPNDPATNVNPSFVFHANEPSRGPILCAVDGDAPVDCSNGEFHPPGLSRSAHTVTVTASDTLGNTATTTFTWLIQ